MAERDAKRPTVKVWDLPTRLFHWVLVALVVFLFASAKLHWMDWHMKAGYAVIALVLYRIAWGLVGSSTARFSDFVKGPRAGIAHLLDLRRPEGPRDVGHNPVGGWMIVALLGALLAQAAMGLMGNIDGYIFAPFAALAGDRSDAITSWHRQFFYVILAMVAAHVLAALVYWVWKRQNLIGAMITGRKPLEQAVEPGAPAPTVTFRSSWLALALFIASSAFVWALIAYGPGLI